jgi:hypothetical protein
VILLITSELYELFFYTVQKKDAVITASFFCTV